LGTIQQILTKPGRHITGNAMIDSQQLRCKGEMSQSHSRPNKNLETTFSISLDSVAFLVY